ncbi:GNAT family N-acetyltransferase [Microbacterium sp. 4R-513]|uniref:GNAT family N-acetyltransferase n=1 Tax=Microbacterium sp. 4R-513 TaxID=2567934 RepID=UPI0013E1E0DC|nr:GNAT family N-acetyltransferase [Microbacterium sp. 4R-513]QIG38941.1 GNAT family N-acetyltransferase [Microbacterium sp. 4R-513]
MSHIELRPLDDDDLDAIFEMMRDPEAIEMAAFTASDPEDRDAFDAWMARNRSMSDVESFVVTERGAFAGTAALFTVDGDREVTYWIARHAWGRGVATEALRLLVAHEPIRPLFARAAAGNRASIAVLERNGFTEVSRNTAFAPGVGRQVEEAVFTLVPTLDGI